MGCKSLCNWSVLLLASAALVGCNNTANKDTKVMGAGNKIGDPPVGTAQGPNQPFPRVNAGVNNPPAQFPGNPTPNAFAPVGGSNAPKNDPFAPKNDPFAPKNDSFTPSGPVVPPFPPMGPSAPTGPSTPIGAGNLSPMQYTPASPLTPQRNDFATGRPTTPASPTPGPGAIDIPRPPGLP